MSLVALAGLACSDDGAPGQQEAEQELAASASPTLVQVAADGCDSPTYFAALEPYLAADAEAVERNLDGSDSTYVQFMASQGVAAFYDLFTPETARVLHQNETHDCQRLIVEESNTLRFGPLVQIALQRELADLPIGTGRVMAELYNFVDSAYAPLGIVPGANCLWMEPGPTAGTWTTLMLDPVDATCQGVNPGNAASSTALRTVPRTVQGANPQPPPGAEDVYPPTGRWMWDDAERLQYIGVRCEDAWCEVTPVDLETPTNPYPNSAALPGWSDRQRLAYMDGDVLVVSELIGEIRPGPAVQYASPTVQATVLKAIGAGGQIAAFVRLEGNDAAARAAYETKLGISTAGVGGVSTGRIRMQVVDVAGEDRWQGWAENRPDDVRDLNVAVDRPHSGLGTVRWRWSDTDERGWLPCRQGCCTWHEDAFDG